MDIKLNLSMLYILTVDDSNMPETEHKLNTLRPRQDGRHFADDIFKRIFSNENV